ncbi:MAG: hypothetical protein Q8Q59_02900 [Luteolibacter sp.]|jgi:hypothetical protein|nr:hypothetical protein [Luteolibacter sp.]
MADSSKSKSGGGCLGKLLFLILLAFGGTLGATLFFIVQPQDLSDIGGYGPTARTASPRDLNAVLQSALKRGYPVTLTEAEINQWLGSTLAAKQGGMLASQVSLERVWVRLEDGLAEVVMERSLMGRPFTVSMFLKVEQSVGPRGMITEILRHGGPYHANVPKPLRGGRFGKLVVPQGFLILVMPAYAKLADLYREEIRLAFEEMARIRIEANRLILNSREPADDPSKLLQTF